MLRFLWRIPCNLLPSRKRNTRISVSREAEVIAARAVCLPRVCARGVTHVSAPGASLASAWRVERNCNCQIGDGLQQKLRLAHPFARPFSSWPSCHTTASSIHLQHKTPASGHASARGGLTLYAPRPRTPSQWLSLASSQACPFQNTMWRRCLLVGLLLLEPWLSFCAFTTAPSSAPPAPQHQMSLTTDANVPPTVFLSSTPQTQPPSDPPAPHSDEVDDLVQRYESHFLRRLGLTRRPQPPPAFDEDGAPAVSDHMHRLYARFEIHNHWEDFVWDVGDKRKELGQISAVRSHRLLPGELVIWDFPVVGFFFRR